MRLGIAVFGVCFIFFCAGSAGAAPLQSSTYFTLGYDHLTTTGITFDGLDGALGWRPGRYLGIEAGVIAAKKSGITLTNEYLEAQGLLPLGSRLSLMGSIGGILGQASGGGSSTSGSGYRVGGGVEYKISPHWFLRGAYHYQTAISHINDYTLGLAIRF